MANLPNSEKIEIFIPSILGYERVARSAAETIAEGMGFSPDRMEDLKTAVAEACMNAIEHGNREQRTAAVTVLMTADPTLKNIEIRVADEGLKQMPEEFPEPGRLGDDGIMRGLGMFFISQLVDEVEFSQLPEGGNQVRMVIYLTKPEEKDDEFPTMVPVESDPEVPAIDAKVEPVAPAPAAPVVPMAAVVPPPAITTAPSSPKESTESPKPQA